VGTDIMLNVLFGSNSVMKTGYGGLSNDQDAQPSIVVANLLCEPDIVLKFVRHEKGPCMCSRNLDDVIV